MLTDGAKLNAKGFVSADVDQDGAAYVEWTTLPGRQKGGQCQLVGQEDDEEDDDAGQCTEDEISCGWPSHGRSGPGCTISDTDYGAEDQPELDDAEHAATPDYGIGQTEPLPAAMVLRSDFDNTRAHRNYLRQNRCDKVAGYDVNGRTHRLRKPDRTVMVETGEVLR